MINANTWEMAGKCGRIVEMGGCGDEMVRVHVCEGTVVQ